jgi:hypothetical protein
MGQQDFAWTCSIRSLDWLLRATGLNPYSNVVTAAFEIGYPGCVDQWSGLKDTQCLVRVLESYGVDAVQEWVDWPRALEIAESTGWILNSTSWYHFVGGRGVTDWGGLWIANSAISYQGIYETINQEQWSQWDGTWQMVWLVH